MELIHVLAEKKLIIYKSLFYKISRFQHGLVSYTSMILNLCVFTDHAFKAMDENNQFALIVAEKTLKKVNRPILLWFTNYIINFLNTYLNYRVSGKSWW